MKTLVGGAEPPPREEHRKALDALKRLLEKARREARDMPR